ncbi:MAG: DUF2339 domain-containing protein [Pseudomonadota bacterium]
MPELVSCFEWYVVVFGFVVFGLIIVIGWVLGFVGFFVASGANTEIKRLRREVERLERRVASGVATSTAPSKEKGAEPTAEVDDAEQNASLLAQDLARQPWLRDRLEAAADLEEAPEPEKQEQTVPVGAQSLDLGRFVREQVSGNWLIWIGGFALILGGAFLVKNAVDAGFFGPRMRIICALIAAAAMVGAAEWLLRSDRSEDNESETNGRGLGIIPAVLAGAGGATVYGAVYAAYSLYGMIPAVMALASLALSCAGILILAARHRYAAMAVLGIVGAYLSPVLTAGEGGNANALLLYVAAVLASGVEVAKVLRWNSVALTAMVGGGFFALLVIEGSVLFVPGGVFVFLPGYLAVAIAYAWGGAAEPLNMGTIAQSRGRKLSYPLLQFFAVLLATIALGVLATLVGLGDPLALLMWLAISVLLIGVSAYRDAFAVAPVLLLIVLFAAVAFADLSQTRPQRTLAICAALIYSAGGFVLMISRQEKGMAALLLAFAPIGFTAALYVFEGRPDAGFGAIRWATVAGTAAVLNSYFVSSLIRRSGSPDTHPAAISAFVVGATLASTLAVVIAADGLWLSVGFAVQVPVMAWLWRRFHLPALKLFSAIVSILATVRLLAITDVIGQDFGQLPIVNMLIVFYLLPSALFWLSSKWFRSGGLAPSTWVVQSVEGVAIVLLAAFTTGEIRHLLNNGDVGSSSYELAEVTLQSLGWLLIVLMMRWRSGMDLTLIRKGATFGLLALAMANLVTGNLVLLNPWWGDGPKVGGPIIANMLLLYYALPGLALGVLAWLCRRIEVTRLMKVSGALAAVLVVVWVVLAVRHAYHAPDLSAGGITDAESWTYTVLMIIAAAFLLTASAFNRNVVLRYAGFGSVVLAVGKVFLVDIASLDGLWRATAFLSLGAALVAIAVVYQRFTPNDGERPEREALDS